MKKTKCNHIWQLLYIDETHETDTKYAYKKGAMFFCQKCLELGAINFKEWLESREKEE